MNTLNTQAVFWLNELSAGTINGAIASNPTSAVSFFGPLPVMRLDGNELRTIAGAAWQASASNEELAKVNSDFEDMMGGDTAIEDIRKHAEETYEAGKLGKCYNPLRGDGQSK